MIRESERQWDCHIHVIESPDRFPLSPGRGYDPPFAPLDACLRMLDLHDLTNGVLVQPSVYGFDNRCMLDALDRADGRLRGIAVPHPDSTIGLLGTMHDQGVRGIRCNWIDPGGLHLDQLARWLPFMRDAGWHVELHLAIDETPDLRTIVDRIGVPVIIDHMGRPAPGWAGAASPAFLELLDLVREGRCFAKLSAPYRLSNQPPPWRDITPLAHALLEANPHGCLWATDWPHTDTRTVIRTAGLIEARDAWMPAASARRFVLTRTPDELYGHG